MENKTCKTCRDNDDGLCDRKGILIEDDDTCDHHRNGRKPVKKISASATVLLTLKVEVQSPYNRITISYNRKGHRAFAVFLLSIFVGKCRRAVSDMRCRSPPLHLDFLHFKNSDGRYLW